MPFAQCDPTASEHDFVRHVQSVLAETDASAARAELLAMTRESHPVYRERAAPAIVRMRGWVMLALERVGVTGNELIPVLETLDTAHDPYLVAASARALRTFATPQPVFIPVVQRALARIRYSDESLTLQQYSGYALSAPATTATRELRATLRWLKPCTPRRHANRGDSGPPPTGGSSSDRGDVPGDRPTTKGVDGPLASAALNAIASLGGAFFPKCVLCWTAYLSVFGLAGLERIPYAPWLLPVFIALMLVNVASVWPGQRGNVAAFALAVAGAQVILVLGTGCEVPGAAPLGLALSTAGSFLSVKSRVTRQHPQASQLDFAPPPREAGT
jgi:hypothetical protein